MLSIVSNAVPGFLKSSVLGSTLFYIYDKFFESTKSSLTEILKITPDSASSYLKTMMLPKRNIQNIEDNGNNSEIVNDNESQDNQLILELTDSGSKSEDRKSVV